MGTLRRLTEAQVAQYHARGYVNRVAAFSPGEARRHRDLLEGGERAHGLAPDLRRKLYLYLRWADDIVRDARILDAVEDLIGPDLLVYHLTLWIKEPRSDAFISWHQDATYFGLSPADHVTAWVALSPSNPESGCVQVVPGSHLRGQLHHDMAQNPANMFPTGQTVQVGPDAAIDLLVLEAGEFSLHHTYTLHDSLPNRSDDRRIGLGISYIPTHCRCSASERLTATLVRGEDRYGHFDLDPRPAADFHPAALAVHAEAMRRWHAARAELIPAAHARAES